MFNIRKNVKVCRAIKEWLTLVYAVIMESQHSKSHERIRSGRFLVCPFTLTLFDQVASGQ